MESRKYDVFVSYSRKDAEIVDRICQLKNLTRSKLDFD